MLSLKVRWLGWEMGVSVGIQCISLFLVLLTTFSIVQCQFNKFGRLDVPINPRLAATGEIFANATCGMAGKEEFCKLVDHVKHKDRIEHCDYCEGRIMEKRHPIQYAIDGFNTWWQSPTLANGLQYHNVDVTLNLRQIYQVHWIIIKSANSPRPGNWILEKSIDGKEYKPWMYFASSMDDCYDIFHAKVATGRPNPILISDDEVYCTTYFSKARPVENGEIHISLTKGRPGARRAPLSPKLIQFMSAQYIRLRLQKILTLFGDRMVLPEEHDSSVFRRYFYSIKDLSVGGRCICYNHATDCLKQIGGKMACDCKHNTCGDHCEKCCPMFNQKLWKPDKPCEKCNCHNHATQCVYNQTVANLRLSLNDAYKYNGGGQCINCQDNTAGINCQSCKDGYYRQSSVAPTVKKPCTPCNCRSVGATGSCVPDDSKIKLGLTPGKCICKPGFKGDDCNECTIGFERVYRLPYCVPCPCSIKGSVQSTYSCKKPCSCKKNVDEWSQCKTCKLGYYNLELKNPEGCSQCFCFGKTQKCKSSSLGAVKVSMMEGWAVTNLEGSVHFQPTMTREGFPIIISEEIIDKNNPDEIYYWSAPKAYLGNLLTSYGSDLSYIIGFSTDESVKKINHLYQVVIEGDGYQLIHNRLPQLTENGVPRQWSVSLSEGSSWEVSRDPLGRMKMDKRTFMSTLVNVTRILIRGVFTPSKVIGIGELRNVTIVKGDLTAALHLKSVEQCACPAGYAGPSCESCAKGYYRTSSDRFQAKCVPCKCHGHSSECDSITGQCQDCKHNTTGFSCDRCERGFYGNAKANTSEGCKPCECPVVGRSLADSCTADSIDQKGHRCLKCKTGYSGNHCEHCDSGYFGNPVKNIPCRKCNCSGNADFNMIQWCDRESGKCRCKPPTIGHNCEECSRGYYGTAVNGDCKSCNCSELGSKNDTCDISGQCECKEHYTSKTCGQCVLGRGDTSKGCPVCRCDSTGTEKTFNSTSAPVCNPVSGKCKCKPGVGDVDCSQCKDGFYGFSSTGCSACKCSPKGSTNMTCDQTTGECICGLNVRGNKCEKCELYHYWKPNATDCVPCDCRVAARSRTCDVDTGQCDCAPNAIGRRCGKCKDGYWGIGPKGCITCPNCTKGRVCNPRNGKCVCPPYTEGDECEKCVSYAYGYQNTTGCTMCKCPMYGSTDSTKCDPTTGQCLCKSNFDGRQCTSCRPGHYGSYKCDRCKCDSRGTRESTKISSGLYNCSLDDGSCSCKWNVEGLLCDTCKNGTFGLTASYGRGCFDCYCSGLTNECSHAPGWILRSEDQQFDIVHQSSQGRNVYSRIDLPSSAFSRMKSDLSSPDPLMIKVPKLHGDLTKTYGSKILDVTLRCEPSCGRGSDSATFVGEAELTSWGRYVVVYDPNTKNAFHQSDKASGTTQDKYPVVMLERYWRPIKDGDRILPANYKILNRNWFMFMLSNITSFFVRGTAPDVKPRAVSLTMTTSLPVNDSSADPQATIRTIEKCECPSDFKGLSCQLPADGFFVDPIEPPPLPGKVISAKREEGKSTSQTIGGTAVEPTPVTGSKMRIKIKEGGKKIKEGSSSRGVARGRSMGEDLFEKRIKGMKGRKGKVKEDPEYGSVVGSGGFGTKGGFIRPPRPGIRKCNCHGKTVSCNHKTGECIGCGDNTEGKSCEKCKQGYYGNPAKGIDCQLCECPLKTRNFAVSCEMTERNGLVCNCAKGYVGARCEFCDYGYFGIQSENGTCKPCGCSKEGSEDRSCDKDGQCRCYEGIGGLKCDRCKPDHALVNKTCVSCKKGCYKEIWTKMKQGSEILMRFNSSRIKSQPNERLEEMELMLEEMKNLTEEIRNDGIKDILEERDNVSSIVEKATSEIKLLAAYSNESIVKRCALRNSVDSHNRTLLDLRDEAEDIFQGLVAMPDRFSEQNQTVMNATKLIEDMENFSSNATGNALKELAKAQGEAENDLKDYLSSVKFQNVNWSKTIDEIEERFQDLHNISARIKDQAKLMDAERQGLRKEVQDQESLINSFQRNITELDAMKKEVEKLNEEAMDTLVLVKPITNQTKEIMNMKEKFENITKMHEGDVSPKPENELIEKLNRTKNSLYDILKKNKQSSKAAMAYKHIINEVHSANDSSMSMSADVANILEIINAKNLTAEAQDVEKERGSLLTKLENITKKYEAKKRMYDTLNGNTNDLSKIISAHNKTIQGLSERTGGSMLLNKLQKINETQTSNEKRSSATAKALKEIEDRIKAIEARMKEKIPKARSPNEEVAREEKRHSDMKKKIKSLDSAIGRVKEKLRKVTTQVGQLKELIEMTHGEAAQGAAPTRVNGGCVRTYHTYFLQQAPFLTLRIWLRNDVMNEVKNDQLIMYGKTPGTKFSWSLEMTKAKKLRLSWHPTLGTSQFTVESDVVTKKGWVEVVAGIYPKKTELKVRLSNETATIPFTINTYDSRQLGVTDFPLITERTKIFLGGFPEGENRPRNLNSVEPWIGCLYAMRINNRAFGPYDIEKASSQCNISVNNQNPFKSKSPCKIYLGRLEEAFGDRFKLGTTGKGIRNLSFSFYGTGYFKAIQYFGKTRDPVNVLGKRFQFKLWPQPFKQSLRSLVMLIFYEPKPSHINYLKLEFQNGKLKMDARVGVETCVAESEEMDDVKFRGTSFAIDFSSTKLVMENLKGNCSLVVENEMLIKASGIYIGGVPYYVRQMFERNEEPLPSNFFGCVTFYTRDDGLGLPKAYGPMRNLAIGETAPYGLSRNVEYSCEVSQPIYQVSFSKKELLVIKDEPMISSWTKKENEKMSFTFTSSMPSPYSLVDFLNQDGVSTPIQLRVRNSRVEAVFKPTSRRHRRQNPVTMSSSVTIKQNSSYFVSLQLIRKPTRNARVLYSVYLTVGDQLPSVRDINILTEISAIRIGPGDDGTDAQITYNGFFIGEKLVNFAAFDTKDSPAGLSFLPFGKANALRMPSARQLYTPASIVSSRKNTGNIRSRRYRETRKQCGNAPNFKTISSSFLMEYGRSVLQANLPTAAKEFVIEMKFRTIRKASYLLSATFSKGHSLIVLIDRFAPYLVICKQKCFKTMIHINVSDASWHSVKVERLEKDKRTVKFTVDGITQSISRKFNSKLLGFAFGGKREDMEIHSTMQKLIPGFSDLPYFGGCMKELFVNQKRATRFPNLISKSGNGKCYSCSTFALNQAYKSERSSPVRIASLSNFQPSSAWPGGFHIIAQIRPEVADGILFSMVEKIQTTGGTYRRFRRLRWRMMRWRKRTRRASDNTAFLVAVMYLKNGTINQRLGIYDRISKKASEEKKVTIEAVALNKWNHVSMTETHSGQNTYLMKLKLNDKEKRSLSKEVPSYFKKFNLQLGGHTELSSWDWQQLTGVRNSYSGCIRDPMVYFALSRTNWKPMILPDLSNIEGLHATECPYAN